MAVKYKDVKQKKVKPGKHLAADQPREGLEIVRMRTQTSKTFSLGGRKRRLLAGMAPLHYKNDYSDEKESWKDIDLTINADGTCSAAPYDLQIFSDKIGYSYQSKRGGRVDVELLELDDMPVDFSDTKVSHDGNEYYWEKITKDMDIKLVLYQNGVEMFKVLKNELAPKKLKWKVVKWNNSKCDVKENIAGKDNIGDNLEINTALGNEVKKIDRVEKELIEEWTGRVSRIKDKETRIKEWKTDPEYPVMIDASTNEQIGTGADDGRQYSTAWQNNSTKAEISTNYMLGFRWGSVNVPQGATITSAKFKPYNLNYAYAGNAKIYFSNADNPSAFSSGDLPTAMPNKIPAGGHAWTLNTAASNWGSVGVTSGVQTIVSRGGWSSGNAMRMGAISCTMTSFFRYFRMYDGSAANAAKLDITYSVGAPAARRIMIIGKQIMDLPMVAMCLPVIGAIKNNKLTRRALFNVKSWLN